MRSLGRLAVGAILAALPVVQPAVAQTTQPEASSQTFPAEYFASSRPADAYDMVRRLPGFELIEGDEDVRGFSGSRGNVLFDGRAPSGKEETLEEALRRIPAASVLRIELIRGGATSSSTAGYDLVANIIRRKIAATNYAILVGGTIAEGFGAKPDGRVELTRQSGDRRFDGALAMTTDIDDESGDGRLIERSADGVETGSEDRDEREITRALSANAEYGTPLGAGDLVGNLSLSRERTRERIESDEDGELGLASELERGWAFEAGAQFQSELASGDLQAVAVQRLGRRRVQAEEEDEEFRESTRTGETIGRAEYRRGKGDLEYFGSLEGAYNWLTSDTRLSEGGVEVPISGSDVDVSERRVEGALGIVWKPSPQLVVEPTMRVERSNIRSTGDSAQDDSFLFWKPRLRGTWERNKTRVQATVEREAAQLDFGDFVASAELGQDDVVAGATSLVPPTTWSFSTVFEQRFWGDGALLLTYRHEWIDNVIDRVVVETEDELFDAVGNIGSGKRRIIRGELTLPFDRFGLDGVEVRAAATFLKSRVTDPVTGERRIISEDKPFEGDLRLTHDLPGGRWSWGADVTFAERERQYRFDQVRKERKDAAFGAFVEYRPAAAWRIRLEAENVGSRFTDERFEYDGLRSEGDLDSVETKRLRTRPIVQFSVRKSFGGNEGQAGSEP